LANLNNLSLYIHIPFCVQRCRYCDFYSETGVGETVIIKTLEGILQSLEKTLSRLKPESIPTVFIGGGTPSLISPDLLNIFLSGLNRIIDSPKEFSIEVNPESLSRDFLDILDAQKVNRISMGVQSYQEQHLKWLGRPAGRDAVDRADSLLEKHWKGRLSRDLLAGLPVTAAEKPGDRIVRDLKLALRNNPGHLSLYELTVEEKTPLAESPEDLLSLPGEDIFLKEWRAALHYLETRGYRRYEISNFAVEGNESLHNLRYWRMLPYLGVGPGGVSTFPGEDGQVFRRQEPEDLHAWLKNPAESFSEESISPGELALEHFMMGLRTSEGLSISHFSSIFGNSPVIILPESLNRWKTSGMLEIDSHSIRPTSIGMELLDTVLADIAVESEKVDWSRFCRWPQP